jgi:cyclopropane fatty-acyl-phospholipid synthase-like methyltransferase
MAKTEKPYAPACDRNREPILAVLRDHFGDRSKVLEVGSGTGQHAAFFAAALPHLVWQTAERREHLAGIRMWLGEAELPNTPPPIELDVNGTWPRAAFDAAFSANTLHIMSWMEVERMFSGLGRTLADDAKLVLYGPFNYGGKHTSESNARFDLQLRQGGAHQGIRDFEAVDRLAREIGFRLLEDRAMPANNRCLVWRRTRRRG